MKLASGVDRLVSSLDVKTPETVAAALREALPARGFDGHDVLTRLGEFTPGSLRRVVATGTDRTETSSCWAQPDGRYFAMNDASPAERAKAGITPERVTYCHRLDLDELPLTLRWGGRHNPGRPSPTTCLARRAFERSGLRRYEAVPPEHRGFRHRCEL